MKWLVGIVCAGEWVTKDMEFEILTNFVPFAQREFVVGTELRVVVHPISLVLHQILYRLSVGEDLLDFIGVAFHIDSYEDVHSLAPFVL